MPGSCPADETALASYGTLTITTYQGGNEGHLIIFPDSTTLSIDCANGNITTKSHFHSDHCASCDSGQYNRDNVAPGQVLYNKDGVTVTVVAANGRVIGEGKADVSCPARDENKVSMALLIKYRGFDYLTAGDLTATPESYLGAALKARGVNVDVLKVSHHGSSSSSRLSYLQDILPEYAVITGTATDPAEQTLDNLASAGVRTIYYANNYALDVPQVYRANGDVVITTDGCTYSFSGGNPPFYHGPYNVDDYCASDAPHLVISEAAIDNSHLTPEDHRWIELYNPPGSQPVDLSALYWVSRDKSGRIAKKGSLTMAPGDVAILHKSIATDTVYIDENNSTGKGSNGWWDVYTQLDGNYWYSTDDCLMISKENSYSPAALNILDAVIWSDRDNYVAASIIDRLNFLIRILHWGNPAPGSGWLNAGDDSAAVGGIGGGCAQRLTTLDTDRKSDWAVRSAHSEGTPPPTVTPPPTPTPVPPPLDVSVNKEILSAGDTLNIDVVVQPLGGRPFDAYAAIISSASDLYSIMPGNAVYKTGSPLAIAKNVPDLPGGFSGVLLSITVPPGVEGNYMAIVGLVDKGARVKDVNSTFMYDAAAFAVR